MDPIQSIFHEKQEGSLCAQHCLNALLQGQYFTAVELADIARQLDEREREHMAEGGVQTDDYQRFIQQPSSNFDDSGFFSVQVIANALTVWNLELLPFNSRNDVSTRAREDPTQEAAFICNFREHWFSVRKLGHQWFNLNSLLSGPELISDTYLAMFLTQLQQEGYALFLVIGELPGCDADEILKVIPAEQPVKPSLITDKAGSSSTHTGETTAGADDEALQRALAESRDLVERDDKVLQRMLEMSRAEDEGRLLEQALQMSMEGADSASMPSVANRLSPDGSETASTSTASLTAEELRNKRLAYLGQPQGSGGGGSGGGGSTDKPPGPNTNNSSSTQSTTDKDEKTEADLLQEAIQLSMEQP